MSERWLSIIGIGEAGMDSLSPAARRRVEAAELIMGGDRHEFLSGKVTAERLSWPHPLDAVIESLQAHRGQRLVVLVTGDPLWYSIGARIGRAIPPDEIDYHPQVSAFQFASCRLGWSIADLETLTAHGRPAEGLLPFFWPGRRLLILTAGANSPGEVARLLADRGFGASRMVVLGHLGGEAESRHESNADEWAEDDPAPLLPDFHLLAVECRGKPQPLLPRWGLPDSAFTTAGLPAMPEEVRILSLARLMPARLETLWDVESGCGSVAIEWCRAARDAEAIAIADGARLAALDERARALGATRLRLIESRANDKIPQALSDLPRPNAVLLGDGVDHRIVEFCLEALQPNGRLVANVMTPAGEALLAELQASHGGSLRRISVEHMAAGDCRDWCGTGLVTQWSLVR